MIILFYFIFLFFSFVYSEDNDYKTACSPSTCQNLTVNNSLSAPGCIVDSSSGGFATFTINNSTLIVDNDYDDIVFGALDSDNSSHFEWTPIPNIKSFGNIFIGMGSITITSCNGIVIGSSLGSNCFITGDVSIGTNASFLDSTSSDSLVIGNSSAIISLNSDVSIGVDSKDSQTLISFINDSSQSIFLNFPQKADVLDNTLVIDSKNLLFDINSLIVPVSKANYVLGINPVSKKMVIIPVSQSVVDLSDQDFSCDQILISQLLQGPGLIDSREKFSIITTNDLSIDAGVDNNINFSGAFIDLSGIDSLATISQGTYLGIDKNNVLVAMDSNPTIDPTDLKISYCIINDKVTMPGITINYSPTMLFKKYFHHNKHYIKKDNVEKYDNQNRSYNNEINEKKYRNKEYQNSIEKANSEKKACVSSSPCDSLTASESFNASALNNSVNIISASFVSSNPKVYIGGNADTKQRDFYFANQEDDKIFFGMPSSSNSLYISNLTMVSFSDGVFSFGFGPLDIIKIKPSDGYGMLLQGNTIINDFFSGSVAIGFPGMDGLSISGDIKIGTVKGNTVAFGNKSLGNDILFNTGILEIHAKDVVLMVDNLSSSKEGFQLGWDEETKKIINFVPNVIFNSITANKKLVGPSLNDDQDNGFAINNNSLNNVLIEATNKNIILLCQSIDLSGTTSLSIPSCGSFIGIDNNKNIISLQKPLIADPTLNTFTVFNECYLTPLFFCTNVLTNIVNLSGVIDINPTYKGSLELNNGHSLNLKAKNNLTIQSENIFLISPNMIYSPDHNNILVVSDSHSYVTNLTTNFKPICAPIFYDDIIINKELKASKISIIDGSDFVSDAESISINAKDSFLAKINQLNLLDDVSINVQNDINFSSEKSIKINNLVENTFLGVANGVVVSANEPGMEAALSKGFYFPGMSLIYDDKGETLSCIFGDDQQSAEIYFGSKDIKNINISGQIINLSTNKNFNKDTININVGNIIVPEIGKVNGTCCLGVNNKGVLTSLSNLLKITSGLDVSSQAIIIGAPEKKIYCKSKNLLSAGPLSLNNNFSLETQSSYRSDYSLINIDFINYDIFSLINVKKIYDTINDFFYYLVENESIEKSLLNIVIQEDGSIDNHQLCALFITQLILFKDELLEYLSRYKKYKKDYNSLKKKVKTVFIDKE